MLTDLKCKTARVPEGNQLAKLYDIDGLYLLVKADGRKYWRWDFTFERRRQYLSYGVYPKLSLRQVRERHLENLKVLGGGINPSQAKKDSKVKAQNSKLELFEAVARDWHATRAGLPAPSGVRYLSKGKWSADHAKRVMSQLTRDIFPVIGQLSLARISPDDLKHAVLLVQDRGRAYTAKRLQEYCSQIFDFAAQQGLCQNNPARLISKDVVAPPVTYRPALTDVVRFGKFLRDLAAYRNADRLTLLATRLAALTLLRSGELRAGLWAEVNLEGKEWRVPASRMKQNKGDLVDHIVPLSHASILTLNELRELTGSGTHIFPASFGGGVLSENTVGRMLIRLGYQGRQSLHGFRASARSILAERSWNIAALERQLDHQEQNKIVRAYARGDYIDERRELMEDWGQVVTRLEAGLIPIPRDSGRWR